MRSSHRNAAVAFIGCLVFGLLLLAPPSIHGDDWNLATRFTVNRPFQVPNMVLQPNTPYVIRLYDSPAERNVVQIFNGDQTRMLTTFMGVSDERMQPTDDSHFTFGETAAGYPAPMKEWFYPGRLRGLEFLYPKQQADEIAQHGRDTVLTQEAVNTTAPATVNKSENTEIAAEKPGIAETAPAPAEPAPVTEPSVAQSTNETQSLKSESEEVQRTKPETEAAPQQTASVQGELPRTAGELPLIGIVGMLCVAGGLGVKLFSAKS